MNKNDDAVERCQRAYNDRSSDPFDSTYTTIPTDDLGHLLRLARAAIQKEQAK